MDAEHLDVLIELGSDAGSVKRIQVIGAGHMAAAGYGHTMHNACAAVLSSFLNEAGIKVPITLGAGALARTLSRKRGWERIVKGSQQPGDVGVTYDNDKRIPGADHVYLVIESVDGDQMIIADNQKNRPHTRYASGNGRTPTHYFLRATASARLLLQARRLLAVEFDPEDERTYPNEDQDTNDLREASEDIDSDSEA